MIKKYKNIVIGLVFTCTAMFIWAYAVYSGKILKAEYNTVSIRLDEDEPITQKSIEKALKNEADKKKEIPQITAWNCNRKSEIYCEDVYKDDFLSNEYIENNEGYIKKEKVQVYEVYGKCNNAYPMELIYGSFLDNDDIKGCIIDRNTCYKLFGTENGVGNSILLEGDTYYVRGVADVDNPAIMIEINEEKHKFNNLELVYSNDERGSEMAEKFMIENGLGDEYVTFDCEFYGKIADKMSKIPAWVIMFFIIAKMFKSAERYKVCELSKEKIFKFVQYVCISSIIIILTAHIAEFEFYYPVRLIPSKWSHFKFWEGRIKELKILMQQFLYMMPYPRDIMMVQYLKESVLCSLVSCINSIILLNHRKILSKWLTEKEEYTMFRLIKVSMIMLAITLIVVLAFNIDRGYFKLTRFYPGILIIYFLFEIGSAKWLKE